MPTLHWHILAQTHELQVNLYSKYSEYLCKHVYTNISAMMEHAHGVYVSAFAAAVADHSD